MNSHHIDIELDSMSSAFSLDMGIWTDETFQTQITEDLVLNVPDNIYMGIIVENDQFVLQGMNIKIKNKSSKKLKLKNIA